MELIYTVSLPLLAERLGVTRAYLWKRAVRANLGTMEAGRLRLTEKDARALCAVMGRVYPE